MTNSEQSIDFGYMMVRPDGVELGLDAPILDRLDQAGFSVIKHRLAPISVDQIDVIYESVIHRDYFPAVRSSMAGRMTLSLLVAGQPSVTGQLLDLKGSSQDSSGTIRGDFSGGHLLDEDLRDRYLNGELSPDDLASPQWVDVRRHIRIHTDDTPAEAARSMRTMFPEAELQEAAGRFPGLNQFLDMHLN